MTPETLPAAYRELAAWLENAGFVVSAEPESPAFGDRAILFSRPPVDVRFLSDRGVWSLELRDSSWGNHDWFEPEIWDAYLRDGDPPTDSVPPEEEARIVRDELAEIVSTLAARPHRELLEWLRDAQERRVLRGLGVHGDEPAEPD